MEQFVKQSDSRWQHLVKLPAAGGRYPVRDIAPRNGIGGHRPEATVVVECAWAERDGRRSGLELRCCSTVSGSAISSVPSAVILVKEIYIVLTTNREKLRSARCSLGLGA
jgi:hypothetical protein